MQRIVDWLKEWELQLFQFENDVLPGTGKVTEKNKTLLSF